MRRFFLLLLSVCILTLCFPGSSIVSRTNASSSVDFDNLIESVPLEFRERMKNQEEALSCYKDLLPFVTTVTDGVITYANEYAGAYIDNGKLIIRLVDDSDSVIRKYASALSACSCYEFAIADYSINDLLECTNALDDIVLKYPDMVGYGISETDNKVVIDLSSSTSRTASSISANSIITKYSSMIEFNYIDTPVTSASINSGYKITNDKGTTMTLGACGKYRTEDGSIVNALLTCGHDNEKTSAFSSKGQNIYYNGVNIGTVAYQRANADEVDPEYLDTLGDFAIVALNSNVTSASNNVLNQYPLTGMYSSLPEGTAIYKYGQAYGLAEGIVTRSAIQSITKLTSGSGITTYFIRGLYQHRVVNYSGGQVTGFGDSGGPVFVTSNGSYLLHGTTSGFLASTGNMTFIYSSPIYYAVDAGFIFGG